MGNLMAIGEFSRRSGLSGKVLRADAEQGVLVPAAVDPESGYRNYEPGRLRKPKWSSSCCRFFKGLCR